MDDHGAVRGYIRSLEFRRLSHGLHLRQLEASSEREFSRELAAWRLVLPEDAVFTHMTAAALYGWWLPRLPEHLPVFAATRMTTRPRRAGLTCSRLEAISQTQVRRGHPVDATAEVLLRAARDLGMLDLVVLVSSARRSGDIDDDALAALTASSRPGVRRLRRAVERSDPRAESPFEVLLRVFHELAGIAVEPQAVIRDADGRFVARADLLVVGTRDLHEYDGEVHNEPRQRTKDLRRDREIQAAGFVRRGFTAPDLLLRPHATLREVDAAIGRAHDPKRVQRWVAWVRESCYSPAGRRRLQNRWLTGAHWSSTT
jgi:very-short-patch-repair endonuclease